MRNIIVTLFSLLLIVGCEKDNDEVTPIVNSYPLEVGNSWNYSVESFGYLYENESSNVIIDTIQFSQTVVFSVEKDTVLNDTLAVKKVVMNYSSGARVIDFIALNDNGLVYFAYAYGEKKLLSLLDKAAFLRFKQQKFEIYYYNEPLLKYKIPMHIGDRWHYSSLGSSHSGYKEVSGKESVFAANQYFDCFEVETIIYWDGEPDNTVKTTEYISEIGRVKEVVEINSILIRADDTEIGFFKGETVTLLTYYNLN